MSETFKQGIEYFQAGNFTQAAHVLRQICQEDASNFRAMGLLGAAVSNTGDKEEGLKTVAAAFSDSRHDPMIGVIYVQLLNQAGNAAEAEEAARKSVTHALSIGDPDLLLETAEGLRQENMLATAATAYNHALSRKTLGVEQGLIAAAVNAAAGSQEGALVHLNALAESGVRDTRVFKAAAEILKQRGNWRQFYNATTALIEIEPKNPEYWEEHAAACQNISLYRESAQAFDRKSALGTPDAATLATGARLWLMANDKAQADALIEQARKAPGLETAKAQTMLAMAYAMQGDSETAIDYLQKAIAIDPLFSQAYVQLNLQCNGALDDDIIEKMKHAATQDDIEATNLAHLGFALGDTYKAKKNYAKAFAEYEKANNVLKQCARQIGNSYNPSREHDLLRRVFAIRSIEAPPQDALSKIPFTPIFIVGMPRTGTTLMEGLLSSHSNVAAGGESAAMIMNFNAYLRDVGAGVDDVKGPLFQTAIDGWRKNYIDAMSLKLNDAEGYVVDKQPLNFKAVGLIQMAFPEAPIIHMRRNPVDTCFSIYRRPFGEAWAFANHLQDLAHFYGVYARYMKYWEEHLPGKLINVQYDNFVENFEDETRRIVSACGLDWQDACLDPGGSTRIINTFSSMQARAGVSKAYSGDAARFSEFLEPLRSGLTGALIDLETGGLLS